MSPLRLLARLFKLSVGALVFTVVAAGAAYVMLRLLLPGAGVEVPDLSGRSLLDALRMCTERELHLVLQREDPSDEVPPGWIVSQHPPPGARVRSGRRIAVVVSRGRRSMPLPELQGMPLRQATATLDRLGLQVGEVLPSGPRRSADARIRSTRPAAGSDLEPRARVHLLLEDTGPPRWWIPDLVGRTWDELRDAAAGTGLRVEIDGGGDPQTGIVVKQEPPPGSHLASGESLRLWLTSPARLGLAEQEGGSRPW